MRKFLASRNAAYFVAGGFLAALVLGGAAHAITDTVFKYSAPKTGYLSLHPGAFAPDGNTSGATYLINWDSASLRTVSGSDCYNAGINLPQGATVTAVTFWMNSSSGQSHVALLRAGAQTGSTDYLVYKTDTDTSATRKTVSATVSQNNVVDKAHFLYGVGVCLISTADVFYGARVTYTYTNAGD